MFPGSQQGHYICVVDNGLRLQQQKHKGTMNNEVGDFNEDIETPLMVYWFPKQKKH